MAYTVKQLAKLSGVSVRTLHFYDQIGLLKPAYYAENNYRYYEEEQLLMLQQILFFRELGFKLNAIQEAITNPDFNKIETLKLHKEKLQQNIHKIEKMIGTIDKTIAHLNGEKSMPDLELFDTIRPRDSKKQQEYETYLINNNIMTKEELDKSWESTEHWQKKDWDNLSQQFDVIFKKLVAAMQNHLKPEENEVQQLIKAHHTLVNMTVTYTRKKYLALSQLYAEHPDFIRYYSEYHEQLGEYLREAMKIFAECHLEE